MSPSLERIVARLAPRQVKPPDDGKRRAAVAIVLRDGDSPSVLLMQRAARADDPWSGHISLPGGGYHAVDGDLATTAMRETREELGVDLSAARLIGDLPPLQPFTSGPFGIEVTPFAFVAPTIVEPALGPEAAAAFWLPLGDAASGALDARFVHSPTGREFPAWRFDGHVVWGLTRRILDDLLALTT